MNRIAISTSYLSPLKSDFAQYKSKLIINKSLMCYALNDNNEIKMVFPSLISEATLNNNFENDYKNMMFQLIDNLPEPCWQQVVQKLNIKE